MKFTFTFLVTFFVTFWGTALCYAQPPNDACLSAEPIVVGVGSCTSTLYTNVAATTAADPATPACWLPNSLSHSVWFSFVATTGDIEISTNFGGTLANTQLAVYSGTCGGLTLLGCQEDVNTGGGLLHANMILHGLTIGNTYYILIDGNGNTTGTFGVCAQESFPLGPTLPNQDCVGSQTLCGLGSISVADGAGGVGSSQEFPSCFGAPGERSANWYSFTAATSGNLCFTINPNTSIDYDFAVYNTTASCPGVELSCNWSPTSPTTGLGCPGVQCETCIAVVAGESYSILVDRFTAASNAGFTLDFAGTTATFASPNPTFTATTACIGSATQFTNTTSGNFTYSWNFGDGFTSNLENPTHTFATSGPHSVTLLITAVPGGCQNSITQNVTVNPLPTANAGTGTSVCTGNCTTLNGTTNAVGAIGPVTFSNTGNYPIADNDAIGVASPITVSGLNPAALNNTSIVSVCVDINHTFAGDLDLYLQAPDGTLVLLSTDNGGGGNNYTNTCFSTTAATPITAGTAPFTGTFIPEGAFSSLNGRAGNGVWNLFVQDLAIGDTGSITNWSLTLNNTLPAFNWTPTTAMTNANTLTPTVCPTVPTTYTLTTNNGPGCVTTSSVTIGITAGPTATIGYTPNSLCTTAAAQAVTLNGTGAFNGGIYSSTAGLSINATTGTITPSASTPGPYTVTYTIPGAGGCPNVTATTTLTITAPPVVGSLSGTQNICVGDNSVFASTTIGGSWISSDNTVATINSTSGLVTAVGAGSATMTYTVLGTGGCGNVSDIRTVTVTAPPVVGTLSGTQNICVGDNSVFASTSLGGSWISSDNTVATINSSSGLVTAVGAGSATMTYTVLGTGGCSNVSDIRTVTVTAPPVVGTLSGTQNICVGDNALFASTTLGGSWVSSDNTVATINSTSGLVTAVGAGNATITYTVLGTGGCANVSDVRTVTVTAPPVVGTLSGTQNICVGDNSVFASTTLGGSWVSSDNTVATINSTSGLLTAVGAGSATMTYTVLGTGGCSNVSDIRTLIVTAPPVVGTLSGTQNICVGDNSVFASTTLGGSWASSDNTVATINSTSGLVTAVGAGSATMTYTVLGTGGCANVSDIRTVTVNPYLTPTINCGTSTTTSVQFTWVALAGATGYTVSYQVNANPVVNAGAIGALTSYSVSGLSPGDSVALTLTPTGAAGTCFSANTATCVANNCVLPTALISYSGAPFCDSLSSGQAVSLSGTGAFNGGVYSSTAGLSINATSGEITPSASTPGPYIVTYTILGVAGCSNVIATTSVTITAAPAVGTLSGTQNICVGDNALFASTTLGGSWVSSDNTVATINTTLGLVTAVGAGNATMTYTVLGTGGCANVSDIRTVTVNPYLTPTINCGSSTTTSVQFTWVALAGATGYTVSYQVNANPVVNAGAIGALTSYSVSGLSPGDSVALTLTPTGAAGTCFSANTATCVANNCVLPTALISYSGAPFCDSLSSGQAVSLSGTGAFNGGVYSSTAGLSINATSGEITPSASTPGPYIVTYTILGVAGCSNVIATTTVSITAAPAVGTLSGTQNICVGDNSVFASTTLGGTWVSSDNTVATINSTSGLVTAVGAGSATMTYTVLGTGGCANVSDIRTVTVTAPPVVGTLSGTQNICVGDNALFASTTLGGSWASSDNTVATINSTSGLVTAVGAGSATMTYTVLGTGGCSNVSDIRTVTVTAPPVVGTLSGTQNICVGDNALFASTTLSGSWVSSDNTVATINSTSGLVTAVGAGSATMTYTVLGIGGCPNVSDIRTVTVTAPPVVGTLSGTQNICVGDNSVFASTTLGGSWVSSDNTVATINSTSGLVTAVGAGSATMTYTVLGTGGCSNVSDIRTVTVTASPVVGTLSGTQNICVGDNAVFASTTLGGTWVSSDNTVATINSTSGLVTAVGAGSATMTYAVLGTGGCANVSDIRTVTVTASPVVGTLSGTQNICVGDNSVFASTTLGGSWVSSDNTVATINSTSGLVTAVGAGSATMTYTVLGTGGCANVSDIRTVTVNPYLTPTINCGSSTTTSVQFTWVALAGATGYTVSYQVNANPIVNVGAIGALTSYSVSGLSPGDSVTLTLTPTGAAGTCFSANTATCVANNCVLPTALISYSGAPFCDSLSSGQAVSLSGTGAFNGGVYSSTAGLSINATSGEITPSASTPGPYIVTYTISGVAGCSNVIATTPVTITAAPVVGTLSGAQNICVGDNSVFASTTIGGSWVSSDNTVATINSTSGLVTAVGAGSATMTYTVLGTGGCANVSDIRTVTVTASPVVGTLSGTQNICVGDNSVFASTTLGGSWTSSDNTVATINSTSGLVTAVGAGSATMTYTVLGTGGCANVSDIRTVTVTAPPVVGTLSGTQNICVGDNALFASTTLGGSWVSSDNTVSTINSTSGLVTAVAAGSATMTYTVLGTGGCANVSDIRTVTVTAPPVVGTLSGTQNICVGDNALFASTTLSGTWVSSDNTVATINTTSGLVTAVGAGSSTMTYTVLGTGGCPNVSDIRTVTVTAPPVVGTLSGTQNICVGDNALFASTSLGGSWISSDNTVATINSTSGLVTAVGAGSATMTYTVLGTGGCSNVSDIRTVTVTASPVVGTLSGTQNICVGDNSVFASTTLGGTWVSSDNTVATINSTSGLVTAVGAGSATMTYTVLGTGGCANVSDIRTVTVTAPPVVGTLSGTQNICVGDNSVFASTTLGGSWTSSDNTVATINSTSGLVTAVGAGSATMTYTVLGTGGCANVSDIRTVTVTAPPVVGTLSGTQNICVGDNALFASTTLGGSWVSSDNTVATINSTSGLVTAVGAGSATMTYTVLGTGGCPNVSDIRTVTVTAPPVVGTLSGTQNICVGDNALFASTTLGGTWVSSDNTVATINSTSGLVTGVGAGSATMTYTVLGTGGCANVSDIRTVTVTAPPIPGNLNGNQTLCASYSTLFFSTVFGGIWTSSDNTIATINSTSGTITAIAQGTATMTYTVLGSGGCANVSTSRTLTVKPTPSVILATNPINICSEDSPNMFLTADFSGTTFSWTAAQYNVSGAATSGTDNLINPVLTATTANTGTVIYAITPTLNGCIGIPAFLRVLVNPKPVPTIDSGVICIDVATGNTAQGHDLNTGLSAANHSFQWYLDTVLIPINTNIYQANQAGVYSVVATNTQTGCISQEVFTTVTSAVFTTTFTTNVSEAFSDNPYIAIQTPAGSGPFLYQLNNGPWQSSNVFSNMISGLHTIRIKDEAGCTDLEGEILILGYPKFFTPNGDTYNDTWNIDALKDLPNSGIYIFDRYGKFVKQISPKGNGWDGTYNGNLLPSTDYWFTVDFVDPNSLKESTFKSHFSLKR